MLGRYDKENNTKIRNKCGKHPLFTFFFLWVGLSGPELEYVCVRQLPHRRTIPCWPLPGFWTVQICWNPNPIFPWICFLLGPPKVLIAVSLQKRKSGKASFAYLANGSELLLSIQKFCFRHSQIYVASICGLAIWNKKMGVWSAHFQKETATWIFFKKY